MQPAMAAVDRHGNEMANITARDVDLIGKEFADKYYDALVAKSHYVGGLDQFYNHKSKYLFVQHGRLPDYVVRGVDEIGRFIVRMKYDECTLKIESTDTIEIRPNRYTVLTVCRLARLGEPRPRKFVQSTVIRYAPSSDKTFSIVGTVFKFDDGIHDDHVFGSATETVPETRPVHRYDDRKTVVDTVCNSTHGDRIIEMSEIDESEKTVTENSADYHHEKLVDTLAVSNGQLPIEQKRKINNQLVAVKDGATDLINESKKCIESPTAIVDTLIMPIIPKTKQKKKSRNQPIFVKDTAPDTLEDSKGSIKNRTDPPEKCIDVLVISGESQTEQKPKANNRPDTVDDVLTVKELKGSVQNQIDSHEKKNVDTLVVSVESTTKLQRPKKIIQSIATKDIPKDSNSPIRGNCPAVAIAQLYVGGLSKLVGIDVLNTSFGRFGKLTNLVIHKSPKRKKGRSERRIFAIVQFENPNIVDTIAKLKTVLLDNGDKVTVEKSIR